MPRSNDPKHDGHLRYTVVIDVGNEALNNDAQRLVVTAACEDLGRGLAVLELPVDIWRDNNLKCVVEGIRRVVYEGGAPTLFSVAERLRTIGRTEALASIQAGTLSYLDEASFRDAIESIKAFHARRLRAVSLGKLGQALEESENLEAFDNHALETFAGFSKRDSSPTSGSDPEIVEREIRLIEAGEDQEGFLSTGIPELDDRTEGLGPGQLILFAGWPGSGKTAFSAQLAAHMAERLQAEVYFEELEMNPREIARRRISSQLGKPIKSMTPEDLAHALALCGRSHRLHWECAGGKLEDFLGRVTRRMITHPNTKAIFVDYLGLLQTFGRGYDPVGEASAVSDALKGLAQRYQVAVVAMQQPNRNREGRSDKRPVVSDLRDSNKIVQDAHKILFLHHPWEHDKSKPRNLIELHVLKDRSGASGGFIELAWSPSTYRFSPWDTKPPQAPTPSPSETALQACLEDLI